MKAFIKRLVTLTLVFGLQSAHAAVIPLDLNDFFSDPTVSVAANGAQATLSEDSGFPFVLLSNDPGLGDPNIIVPVANTLVEFDYNFTEDILGNDQFSAFLTDDNGLSFGGMFSFVSNNTSSGTIAFNLSSLVGQTLGLTFQLASLPADNSLSSVLEISNLRLVTDVVQVAEPSYLTALCLPFVLFLVRKKSR